MQRKPPTAGVPGKSVGNKRYLHVDALPGAVDGPEAEALLEAVARAEALAGLRRGEHFNLVRIDADGAELALLHYPGFVEEPFPAHAQSWRVDHALVPIGNEEGSDAGQKQGQCGLARPRVPAGESPAWVIVSREPTSLAARLATDASMRRPDKQARCKGNGWSRP